MWSLISTIAGTVISKISGKKRVMLILAAIVALGVAAAGIYFKGRADAAGACENAKLRGEIKSLELFGGIASDNAQIRAEHSGKRDTVKRLRSGSF